MGNKYVTAATIIGVVLAVIGPLLVRSLVLGLAASVIAVMVDILEKS